MRRPLPAFTLFVAIYLFAISWGWFQQHGSTGELPGHAAKTEAILQLLRSGDFAWFPGYLTGAPTATLLSFVFAIPVYAPGLWLAPTPEIGMKITALVLLALGGFTAFAFGRRIASGYGWSGFAVGGAYLLAPQLLLRTGWQEHMTILIAIPLVPLAFLALLRVAERGTPWDAILLAASWSASLLAWSKMGATLVLSLGIFALWLFCARPECRRNLLVGALWAVPATILLGVIPLLPLLRERAFMTVFELDPFAGWQATYSVKTATAWFDRAGALFGSLPIQLRIDRGGYYLGAIGLLAVAGTMIATWKDARPSRTISIIRVFLLIALTMFWLSFGPRSVIQGHFLFLTGAENVSDFVIPLHWLALAAQGFLIFWCLPHWRGRGWIFAGVFAVYLFVPAFRIVELLPVYGDLRAPDSFWILNGTFAWVVASSLALVFLLERIPAARLRPILAVVALVLACLDFSIYFSWFYQGGLKGKTSADFQSAMSQGLGGGSKDRVYALSGRYFYLEIPNATGRPLTTEALNHYLLPKESARLQAAANRSANDMLSYLQMAGVGSVLIDQKDFDIPQNTQKWFRGLLPLKFENESFAVLSNGASLYPAFFAVTAVVAAKGYDEYLEALEQSRRGVLTIAQSSGGVAAPASLPEKVAPGPTFQPLATSTPRSPSRVSLTAPGKEGWAVLSESWHPDWKASIDGKSVPLYRGAGGYPAVSVPADAREIVFRFQPPGWYSACLWTGALSWIAALAFLAMSPILPRRYREKLVSASPLAGPLPKLQEMDRPPISRPLAIVPTYNEAGNIEKLLALALAAKEGLDILVVDDGSPDGTAARVRAHSDFEKRVYLLERPCKSGLGSAYRDGFRWAAERKYDACIEIDADLSHDPADIPRLLATLDEGADAAIASRYLDGVRVVNWPRHRLLLSTGASRYVHALTRLPLTDATSGFKALRMAALERIDWAQLRTEGYGFQVELHWLLWTGGFRLTEVPIVFTERRAGQTKMTVGIAMEAAWRVAQLSIAPIRP